MMASIRQHYKKDLSVIPRQIAGETILVPVRQNLGDMESIYVLNETATRAWELFDGERSLQQICDQIVQEFDVDPQDAEFDLLELVDQLEQIGALAAMETLRVGDKEHHSETLRVSAEGVRG
jgi:hypothetical protein